MKRKDFIKNVTAGSLGAAAMGSMIGSSLEFGEKNTDDTIIEENPKPMVLGCQRGNASEENLQFKARHGVFHFDPGQPRIIDGVGWDLEDSLRIVEAADKYGISIDAYHLPLSSGERYTEEGIGNIRYPNIMLGKSPERDREIEQIQQMIEVAAKSEVYILLYNTTILEILRTGETVDPNRGNASYSTWNYEEAIQRGMDREMTLAGEVDVDEIYERITYLLDRLIPVAEEYNVKLGNHIADPPTPAGYRGITRWNSPDYFEGIKRFSQLYDSPCHGYNFCVGCSGEGLEDPRNGIYPIIKWVGERNQLFNVHLRNIKGGWNNFQEVYPDNGVMDFVHVMKALKDVGYSGMVMPDHVPDHPDPGNENQAFAFAYGYIKALLQSMYGFDTYPDHMLRKPLL